MRSLPGALRYTDSAPGYDRLLLNGYLHQTGFRFSASMHLFSSVFDTVIIERIASVNRANSGLSGGVFMALS
jgi:hypothetical protein